MTASASGLGQNGGKLTVQDNNGNELATEDHALNSADEALHAIARALATHGCRVPQAIGHRVVHGGSHLRQPCTAHPAGRRGTPAVHSFRAAAPARISAAH